MISIIHPSRGRAKKSAETIRKFLSDASLAIEVVLSLDEDDPTLPDYVNFYDHVYDNIRPYTKVISKNKSAVDAINNAAKVSQGQIMIVVSDDTDCFPGWDQSLYKEIDGKHDFILKTQDGIQDWIITMPVMDRAYYNRFGYIYDPDFLHMFCDTWLTVQADISGRKITSNLKFPHLNGSIQDDLRKRCDATWDQGEKTFIQKVRQTPIEDLNKITDRGMKNWIRNKTGIRV